MSSKQVILFLTVSVIVAAVRCSLASAEAAQVEREVLAVQHPVPDITWEPRPTEFSPVDPRYIDFENGDDANPGTQEEPWQHHPWDKNATGAAAACTGVHTYCFKKGVVYRGALIANESGTADTPITLTVDPTWGVGKASIYGSVMISGPWKRCTDAECPEIPAGGRSQTWYVDTDNSFVPRMLWELHGDEAIRIPIARTPNWEIINPDDPRGQWWELTGRVMEVKVEVSSTEGFRVGDHITGTGVWADVDENRDNIERSYNRLIEVGEDFIALEVWEWKKGEIEVGAAITNGTTTATVVKVAGGHDVISRLIDEQHFIQDDPSYWVGATMWAERERMPKPDAEKILAYDPQEHSLRINYHRGTEGARRYDRYYLENLPKFLDSPGEFYYAEEGEHAGQLFVRLPEDRDPNTSIIEAGRELILVDLEDKSNITLRGLDVRFSNALDCGTVQARHATSYSSLVRLTGSCHRVSVLNCELSHASAGVVGYPREGRGVLDWLEVSDNDIHDIDSSAIAITNGRGYGGTNDYGGRPIHLSVLRNRVQNAGYRTLPHWVVGQFTIQVRGGELTEIAGNVVDNVWGAGIWAFTGSGDAGNGVRGMGHPLMRTLIHHNKVTNALLALQDYGAIASWHGGPSYVYNNISGNAVGYKHSHWRRLDRKDWYRTSCYGPGIYFDGQYKGYLFNNVVWGKNNNVNDRIYNSVGFNEACGFMNVVFNNTIYRCGVGLHKGMWQHNRCYYLGNLMLDIGHKFIQQEPSQHTIEPDSVGYAKNVFNGVPANFGQLAQELFPTLEEWQSNLTDKQAMVSETGELAQEPQVISAEAHDFRPRPDSVAVDHGVKVFVPWGLYAVVGEWGFYKHAAAPSLIVGENMYLNDEWHNRWMFDDIPRNHLTGHGIDASNFKTGVLEDWVEGVLELNGTDEYCDLADSTLRSGYEWSVVDSTAPARSGSYEGEKRVTVDMDTNDFLIEAVLRTRPGLTGGGIACKQAETGYSLQMDQQGGVRLSLQFGQSGCWRSSAVAVNDGEWHHVIAEVFRAQPEGINIYVDGKLANGRWSGTINPSASLSNTADFTVGRTPGPEPSYYAGELDFLRVSRGTLADAETTIEELYQWEFAGPFLTDFYGRQPSGKCRDAGALEHTA